MNYLHWDEKTITDLSENNISEMYSRGYVFTRIGKGVMHQTRSVRIDLSKFEQSSENRRVLKKAFDIRIAPESIPYSEYHWEIAKLAKDFYSVKFGQGIKPIIGAAKVKEVLTDASKSNFNRLLTYIKGIPANTDFPQKETCVGYSICYMNTDLMHYSYPFYDLDVSPKDMGMAMMIMAISYAKEAGLKHIYLGSLQRPSDTYKLQFSGLEWFDGGPQGSGAWSSDLEAVKKLLSTTR